MLQDKFIDACIEAFSLRLFLQANFKLIVLMPNKYLFAFFIFSFSCDKVIAVRCIIEITRNEVSH